MSSRAIAQRLSQFLSSLKAEHQVYSYPSPLKLKPGVEDDEDKKQSSLGLGYGRSRVKARYGEDAGGIVLGHLPLFLTVFHAHSVAALTMSTKEHFQYVERSSHTMFNPAFISRAQEGQYFTKLAAFKLGITGVIEYIEKKGIEIFEDLDL